MYQLIRKSYGREVVEQTVDTLEMAEWIVKVDGGGRRNYRQGKLVVRKVA